MKKEVGMMLKVENLNVHYGVIHAIEDVNIEVRDGEIVTLIGANGAGKTTILHTITGLKKATSGSVVFDGTDLLKEQPSKIITPRRSPCTGRQTCICGYDRTGKSGNGCLYVRAQG